VIAGHPSVSVSSRIKMTRVLSCAGVEGRENA
jgi:hypothetical protein